MGAGGVDIATLETAHGQRDQLGISKAGCSGVQNLAAWLRAKNICEMLLLAVQCFPAVTHSTLDAGPGQVGVARMAFALDGVVDDIHRLASAHMDGTDGVEENRGLSLVHEFLLDRKNTRLNSSHAAISYAVFCLKKKKKKSSPLTSI